MTSAATTHGTISLPPPATRADLLSLLAEACELEHGLACSYLYAAFSLKQDASEGGLTTAQVPLVRQWAAQIFFVAAQEMLHLAQAWNLLVAAGAAPYYLRPNFPQRSNYYPLHLPLTLRPFSVDAMSGFVAYEKPATLSPHHAKVLNSLSRLKPPSGPQVPFHSIAQLYDRILEGFEMIPEVFVADAARQTGRDSADFPDLVLVTDRDSARRAIERIRFQGEGVADDRQDCHFGVFMKILEALMEEQRKDEKFQPAREAESNPTVLSIATSGAPDATPITHNYSQDVAVMFDSTYSLMLKMLSYAFSASGQVARAVGKEAIRIMPTVIKPLGEALMLLPSGGKPDSRRAGPGFGLTRHVLFPDDPAVALKLSLERLAQLAKRCDELAEHAEAPRHLKDVADRLRLAAQMLDSHHDVARPAGRLPVSKKKTGSTNISSVIRKHLDAFRKPGVLTVRPGYEIREHQLTGKEAIVATVHTKKKTVARQDLLLNTVDGVPVDVREATPFQRLRAADPGSAAIAKAYGRQELNEPVWPGELEMPSGKPLVSKPVPSHIALDAHANKPQVPYTPAPGASLVPVEDTMTITTAVSPDCGLDTLDNFLATSKSSLVIGMYDFTSGPILTTFENLLKSGRTLQMVLDNPPLNPTANQSDPETMHALQGELGARFQFEWALERNDGHVSAWVFPSAYHIKVIVRDGSAVWLSSGNLNNSNEPDFDAPAKTEDRDWHVIVENQNVAKTFSAFIQHDFQVASGHQAEAPDVVQSAVRRSMLKLADNTNPPPTPNLPLAVAPIPQFKPQTFQNANPKITPLLTPDSLPNGQGQYMSQMLALIESAKKSLDIQLQYIEVPKGDSPGDLKNLLLAVKALVDDGVVQVRVIQSLQYGEKWAEQMRSMPDIDLTPVMKLQPNVHNKGFVIDSQTVVVSSQNWSGAGIRQNRDAGLIIESPAIAQYFESVFNSDWTKNKPFNPQAAAPTQRGVSVARLRSREPGTSTAKQRSTKRKRSGKPAR